MTINLMAVFFSPDREAAMASTLLGDPPLKEAIFFDGTPIHLVTGHEEIRSLLTDPRISNDPTKQQKIDVAAAMGVPDDIKRYTRHNLSMLDDPEHTYIRKLVGKTFTSRRIEQARSRIAEITDDLLDTLRGDADLLQDFAYPLPVRVICEILGVPVADWGTWRSWSAGLTDQNPAVIADSARKLFAYVENLVADKRQTPGNDLLSALVVTSLTDEQLSSLTVSLLRAGHETTANVIANGVHLLLADPEQLARVRSNPSLIPSLVEELLRFSSVTDLGTVRYTAEPMEIAGVKIGAGEPVLPVYYAGNRDPRAFAEPGELRVDRGHNPHLGFGHGAHYCLGAPLARVEAEIAFTNLLARFPRLRRAGEGPTWSPGPARSLPTLQVHLH